MAKYADYVKKQEDNVDAELATVQQTKESRTKAIPESVLKRFDGKSLDDVLESYAELQVMNSRQGEDLGKLRKTVDQLLELQSQPTQPSVPTQAAKPEKEITVDDIYDAPEETIGKVVEKKSQKTSERIDALENALVKQRVDENLASLTAKYTDWKDEIKSTEFVDWIKSSPARTRLAQAANAYDFDAANDLLELWYDNKNHKSNKQKVEEEVAREQQFRDATLESSSPAGADVVETFSRSDLIEKRIRAKNGDSKMERWLRANNQKITLAYEEGRITD